MTISNQTLQIENLLKMIKDYDCLALKIDGLVKAKLGTKIMNPWHFKIISDVMLISLDPSQQERLSLHDQDNFSCPSP